MPAGAWGPQFEGAYLYSEYVHGQVFVMVPQPGGGHSAVAFSNVSLPTTLRFGPSADGLALYCASRDKGGEIHRIVATGAANRQPTAVAKATRSAARCR